MKKRKNQLSVYPFCDSIVFRVFAHCFESPIHKLQSNWEIGKIYLTKTRYARASLNTVNLNILNRHEAPR